MWKRIAVGAVVAVGLVAVPAPARLIDDWPYDKLLKEADLVVFATAVKTEDADDKPPGHSWPYEFAAQNTTFKVKHALTGKAEGEQIKVLHFKFGELKKGVDPDNLADKVIIDGPRMVAFRTGAVLVKADGDAKKTVLPKPEYLLFLKKMKDGRYEPVSGRIDRRSRCGRCPQRPTRCWAASERPRPNRALHRTASASVVRSATCSTVGDWCPGGR